MSAMVAGTKRILQYAKSSAQIVIAGIEELVCMGMKRAANMALGGIASVLLSVNGWAGEARAQAIEGKRGPSVIIAEAPDDQWRTVDPAQVVVMELEHGRITIELSDFLRRTMWRR